MREAWPLVAVSVRSPVSTTLGATNPAIHGIVTDVSSVFVSACRPACTDRVAVRTVYLLNCAVCTVYSTDYSKEFLFSLITIYII